MLYDFLDLQKLYDEFFRSNPKLDTSRINFSLEPQKPIRVQSHLVFRTRKQKTSLCLVNKKVCLLQPCNPGETFVRLNQEIKN